MATTASISKAISGETLDRIRVTGSKRKKRGAGNSRAIGLGITAGKIQIAEQSFAIINIMDFHMSTLIETTSLLDSPPWYLKLFSDRSFDRAILQRERNV